jgi:hypothetical protein
MILQNLSRGLIYATHLQLAIEELLGLLCHLALLLLKVMVLIVTQLIMLLMMLKVTSYRSFTQYHLLMLS